MDGSVPGGNAPDVIGLIAVIIIGFAALWFFFLRPAPTYPLGDGDRLEYIGSIGYGCILVCDANPSNTYYYGTDLELHEIESYFKKAKKEDDAQLSSTIIEDKEFKNFWQKLKTKDGASLYFTFYEDGDGVTKAYEFRHTGKNILLV
jgi:hypothetical protein